MEELKPEESEALRAEALAFLEEHRKMVFTVLDKEKHPTSSLLLYEVDDDFNIYFGTRRVFGKYHAILADPHVSLAVVEEKIDPSRVVDIQGVAEEIPQEEIGERLAWFESRNPSKNYIIDAEDYTMFRIKPSVIHWLDATSGELMVHDISN